MSTAVAKAEMPQHSLIVTMANKYGLERGKFLDTLAGTIFPAGNQAPSQAQIAAFLVVANQYSLNPFIKEIYAFPGKGGGIVPIVSIDGWNTIINRQPNYDGVEFEDHFDENGKLSGITAKVYRKDRSHPTMVTEYLNECKRDTDPWKKWPSRMLRHKAMIQAARYAFGLAGIYDPDEAERIAETGNGNGTAPVPVAVITEEQRTSLVALAQERSVVEKLGEIVNAAGFEMLAHITVDKYQDVKSAILRASEIVPEPEAEAIVGEPVLDDTPALVDEPEEIDPLEALRADVQARLDELPKMRYKDLIAGKTLVSKMDEAELRDLLKAIEAA